MVVVVVGVGGGGGDGRLSDLKRLSLYGSVGAKTPSRLQHAQL